jgi:hypothetical protein
VRIRILCSALASAILIAACGGAAKPAAQNKVGPYGPRSSPYAMSKCMRANGLTNFPDPVQSSGGVGFPGGVTESIEGGLTVDGVSFSGPALKKASQACKIYLPGGGGPPPAPTAAQKAQILKLARCMRANGVPSFPDPSVGAVAPGKEKQTMPDANTPAFKHAIQVCGRGGQFRVRAGNIEGP